jgi:hypothetical protein
MFLKTKALSKDFGCGMKGEHVAPHAEGPWNFLLSQGGSWGVCYQEGGEVASGYDPRGLVTGEHRQAALVAGHKIICLARFRQGQQVVVARVR